MLRLMFSDTHDLLNCRCTLAAVKIPRHKRIAVAVDDLLRWNHFDSVEKMVQKDKVLTELVIFFAESRRGLSLSQIHAKIPLLLPSPRQQMQRR